MKVTTMKLWKHQTEMVEFALEKKRVLWNVWMAGGKTLAGAEVLLRVSTPALIVCPKSVIPVWEQTLKQLDPKLPIHNMQTIGKGPLHQRVRLLPRTLRGVVLVNYDLIHRDELVRYLLGQKLRIIIADESHRIKAHNTQSSKALAKIGQHVEYKLCLTGTPTPNNPLDVFGQFRFLDVGIFGKSWVNFRSRYADTYTLPGTNVAVVNSYVNQDELADKMRPYMYSLTLDDMLSRDDLPDFPTVQHITIPVQLPSKIHKALKALQKEYIAEIEEGTITARNVLVKMVCIGQLISGLAVTTELDMTQHRQLVDTTKLDTLLDFLSDLDRKEAVVVFAQFRHEIDYLREKLGTRARELSGVYNELAEWQAGNGQVLLVQINAGAEGVDLTRARIGVFFSNTYDLGKYQQAIARLQRNNSAHSRVVYYHIVAQDTADEALYKALSEKKKVNDVLFDYIQGRS